jgi:Methyltransferase domain
VVLGVVQSLAVAALAYLVRSLRRSHRETVEFRDRLLVSTERLVNQSIASRKRATMQGKRLISLQNATERAQKHHEYVVELGRQLNRNIESARTAGERLGLVGQRQTQALLNLHQIIRLEAAVPPAGGWAASPDLILFCVDTLLSDRPSLVVECGSGISTLFMALAVEQHGLATRVVALEHDERYAASTRALLARHGVQDRAEVRLAQLEPTSLEEHAAPWYAESALHELDHIGVLLVDGPPTGTGPQARFPAVPLLRDRFAAKCTIVMDDLIRESDHATAEAWAQMLPDFDYSVVREFEKHIGILRRS